MPVTAGYAAGASGVCYKFHPIKHGLEGESQFDVSKLESHTGDMTLCKLVIGTITSWQIWPCVCQDRCFIVRVDVRMCRWRWVTNGVYETKYC